MTQTKLQHTIMVLFTVDTPRAVDLKANRTGYVLSTKKAEKKRRKVKGDLSGFLKKETGFSKTRQTMENYIRFYGTLSHLPLSILMLDDECVFPKVEECSGEERRLKFNVKWFINDGVAINKVLREKTGGKDVLLFQSVELPVDLKNVLPSSLTM